jgi:hypothetical protein
LPARNTCFIDGKPFPEKCRISRRVFAFKYDRSGKVYRCFVKYSPLITNAFGKQVVGLLNIQAKNKICFIMRIIVIKVLNRVKKFLCHIERQFCKLNKEGRLTEILNFQYYEVYYLVICSLPSLKRKVY